MTAFRALWSGIVPAHRPPGRCGRPTAPAPMTKDTHVMTASQDVDADADRPDDDTAGPLTGSPAAGSAETVTGPPRAQRVDVRRRLMALRRW